MSKAFISYSVKDADAAMQLHGALTQVGVETFLAGISLEAGSDWTQEIFNSLKDAEWVFFLASKNSIGSHAVQQELGASLIQEKIIIPILLDVSPEELPGWVNKHQAIDSRNNPESLKKTIESIGKKVKDDKFWSGVVLGGLAVALFAIASK